VSEVLNPVDAETAIRNLGNRLSECVKIVTQTEAVYVEKKRVFDIAEAKATLAADGSNAQERAAVVTLAVENERLELDVAFLAFRDAERRMRAIREQLSAAQSLSRSVLTMYGAAS